jgi:signal transduction histidine kinase
MSSTIESQINPYSLKYKTPEIEQYYAEMTLGDSKKFVYASIFLSIGFYAVIFALDNLILGRFEWKVFWVLLVAAPAVCLLAALVLKIGNIRNRKQLDILSGTFLVISQSWQFYLAFSFPELGGQFLLGSVILSIMGNSGFSGTNFRAILPVALYAIVTYLFKISFLDDTDSAQRIFQGMMCLMVGGIGLSSGYMIERATRIDFLKTDTLEKRQQQLLSKNKELEQFTYIASHDLQEPLRSVTSFSQLLDEEYRDKIGEEGGQYLNFLMEASTRMRNLIKGLLDYSRLGREAQLVPIDTGKVVTEILVDLSTAIAESKAAITIDPLPTITGYETEFRQLMQNLMSNAIKFRRSGLDPAIHVSAKRKGNGWEFSVKDNGIGIESDHQEKIFLIFQRLHNRSLYEGTGIGLANCRKIVELHGGTIRVESIKGQGSNFYFTIPTTVGNG